MFNLLRKNMIKKFIMFIVVSLSIMSLTLGDIVFIVVFMDISGLKVIRPKIIVNLL